MQFLLQLLKQCINLVLAKTIDIQYKNIKEKKYEPFYINK